MKIQGKEKKQIYLQTIILNNLKKTPNIVYVHLSFYGFEKPNNLEKTDSRKNNFQNKRLLFKKIINIIVIVEYDK